jgi:hypothetical protein
MNVIITIYHEQIQKLIALVKVVEVKPSAIVVNMYDATVKIEDETDCQCLYVAGQFLKPQRA